MDQWLVRTAQNQITGPFTKEQVCKLISGGQLGLQDEVCVASGFWFYIHEREEVSKQLGMEVPRALFEKPEDGTETETDTQTLDADTDPGIEGEISGANAGPGAESSTTTLSSRALKQLQAHGRSSSRKTSPGIETQFHKPVILGAFEGPTMWRGLIWGLVVLAGFLVFSVLRLLH